MVTRKLTTIHSLEELKLKPQTLKALKEANVAVEELITAARAYMAWKGIDRLTQYPGIGEVRAKEIVQVIDEAGFILHESKQSRSVRRLLVAVLGKSDVLLEHYEDLEDMAPEALDAVDTLIHEVLPERGPRDAEVIEMRFGLKDGQPRSFEECARKLGYTEERVRQLEAKALARLRHPSRLPGLKVAACYSREALARRMATLWSDIGKLQVELDALQSGSPYPEFKTAEVAGMSIRMLDPSVRTYNCLKRAGINTVGELCQHTENDLLNIRNFSVRSLEEVKELLRGMGLTLAS